MKTAQAVCNYALLQFLPYPETGEFANVGVLVACEDPCLLRFEAEEVMTGRMQAMFPQHDEKAYSTAMKAMRQDMERAGSSVRDPKTCIRIFNELTRRRQSVLRFGEVRTILADDPPSLSDALFRRYVRLETPQAAQPRKAAA